MDEIDGNDYTAMYFKPLTLQDDNDADADADVDETLTTPNYVELCLSQKNTNTRPMVALPAAIAKSTMLPFENDLQIEVFNKLFQKETAARRDTYNKLTGHYDSIMESAQRVDEQMDIYSDNMNNMFINLKAKVKDMEIGMLNNSKEKYAEILKKNPTIEAVDQEKLKKYLS